jgi:thioredoxin-like negative regulator of GroEL
MSDYDLVIHDIKQLCQLNNFPQALIKLRQIHETDPENPQINLWIAICLVEIGEFVEAKDYLSTALEKTQL